MVIGAVGLGLIGGSVAKAYKAEGHRVLAFDTDDIILEYSMMSGVTDEKLTEQNIEKCDVVFISVYPGDAVRYLEKMSPYIKEHTFVIDCCGTKRNVCKAGFELAEKYGYTFVGGHPMAGTHNSGFKFSREDMFKGAPMVIVPPVYDDMELLDKIKHLLLPLGFKTISVTTAEKHDEMIAFTSQMAHIVSNAYVKSPEARKHKGFSAGSYKDLTRVAWLNPNMWTELFMENSDNLLAELDGMIERLCQYRNAIKDNNSDELRRLLDEGRRIKGEIDG